jgi:hypothetical protein
MQIQILFLVRNIAGCKHRRGYTVMGKDDEASIKRGSRWE